MEHDAALFAAGIVVGMMMATVMAAIQAVLLYVDEQRRIRPGTRWKWGK